MEKYYICKETAVLREHQRIRAERVLHKRVDQWDGGDILNVVFDGDIQNRIDWDPETIGVYDTLEEAQDAAAMQRLKSTVITYGTNRFLTAYYISERSEYYEEYGQYSLPREVVEEEVPDREKDIDAFAEYLYRQGYDACDICKLREAYALTETQEDVVYSTLQSLYDRDERILNRYYGKFRGF